jgi:hypothetical protein
VRQVVIAAAGAAALVGVLLLSRCHEPTQTELDDAVALQWPVPALGSVDPRTLVDWYVEVADGCLGRDSVVRIEADGDRWWADVVAPDDVVGVWGTLGPDPPVVIYLPAYSRYADAQGSGRVLGTALTFGDVAQLASFPPATSAVASLSGWELTSPAADPYRRVRTRVRRWDLRVDRIELDDARGPVRRIDLSPGAVTVTDLGRGCTTRWSVTRSP